MITIKAADLHYQWGELRGPVLQPRGPAERVNQRACANHGAEIFRPVLHAIFVHYHCRPLPEIAPPRNASLYGHAYCTPAD